ncbi:MAG: hypothetical protein HYS12_02305, partial [Planctomycetes bacterium]|nr:hypothetical protein [Planctomycetota bacterium]
VDLRKQFEQAQATLKRYDDARGRAAELRKDATALEDALAALNEAKQIWDSPAVRQDIADCTLALQVRRDCLSVADFEVRGEVGLANAGKLFAERLLPGFKARFDLVERSQLGKVLEELKLEATGLAASDPRYRELGRLAKVRYLVVGSVSRVGGISVDARLVDVRTGLIVQTGTVTGATPDEVLPLLPRLAHILQLKDEQKIRYEEELARQAVTVQKVTEVTVVPPAPEVVVVSQPPPPVVVYTPLPPDFGALRVEDFDRLPAAPPPGTPPPPLVFVVERENPIKQRLLSVSLEIGDSLFRCGRYREAFAQYEFALTLAPGHSALSLRLDRCRPLLPPPVVVVAASRPRVAVLNFGTWGRRSVVPSFLGPCTADAMAPYFSGSFDVVDRCQVLWYMHRLGFTMGDVLNDPCARRWLARSLGIRYFVFGTLNENGGIDAGARLVDAEYGFVTGAAALHVGSIAELKLRLPELARLTLLPPEVVVREVEVSRKTQTLLVEAQANFQKGNVSVALELSNQAQQLQPDNVEIHVSLQLFGKHRRRRELEETRRQELLRQQTIALEIQRQQAELARAAEEARLQAEREAAARAEADRLAEQQRREAAYAALVAQGQAAIQQNNFNISIQIFQSAVSLKQSEEGFRLLALAKAKAAAEAQARAATLVAVRERELREQRQRELDAARERLEREQKRIAAAALVAQKAREERDRAAYQRLLDDAERFRTRNKFADAIATLQTARQVRNTDEVNRLLVQVQIAQAQDAAAHQGERERRELERRLTEERERRVRAEAEAKRNRDRFEQLMQTAQAEMVQKRYEIAVARYQEAAAIFRTDAVLAGLRQAELARDREKGRLAAERKQREKEAKHEARVRSLLDVARKATAAGRFDEAARSLDQVAPLLPGDPAVLQARQSLDAARQSAAARATADAEKKRAQEEAAKKRAAYSQFVAQGQDALRTRNYAAAAQAFRSALSLQPNDPVATRLLQDAERGATADAARAAEEQRRQQAAAQARQGQQEAERRRIEETRRRESFNAFMGRGQAAMAGKRYAEAAQQFRAALQVIPGEPTATAWLAEAQRQLNAGAKPPPPPPPPPPRQDTFEQMMQSGAAAERAQNYAQAAQAYREALRQRPQDARATSALRFAEAMADGQRLHAARQYAAAAMKFEQALRLAPGNADAQKWLQKARDKRP